MLRVLAGLLALLTAAVPGWASLGCAQAEAVYPPVLISAAPEETAVAVDVLIYGTQTSGLTAAHELVGGESGLRVAIVSSGPYLESPLAQGLSVEDARDVDAVVGGAYEEWRDGVIDEYETSGLSPFTDWGRFAYEPWVADRHLRALLAGSTGGPLLFYAGRLVAAEDDGGVRSATVQLVDGSLVTIDTRYFIDASVEADLARMLGASYRIGRDETVYNDVTGPLPAYPCLENDYATAPQRLSVLLTLAVGEDGAAPRLRGAAALEGMPSVATVPLDPAAVSSFGHSWSMVIARLPNQARELNETWSDYPDPAAAFEWVFQPAERPAIAGQALLRALGQVTYLQENGYPRVEVARLPDYPYVREGPRVVGLTTYTAAHVVSGLAVDVVATGCYARYDRHDAVPPDRIETTATARLPLEALLPAGHPWLAVSTAVSTDCRAYSSAVRTELARANMGGAAGVVVLLAAREGIELPQVTYDDVRDLLQDRGYELR